ncbi:hypothetical protein LCE31_28235, partial [Streptomyces sp. 8L]|nr:hypothetical protein [Streptomyces sp. 8L]
MPRNRTAAAGAPATPLARLRVETEQADRVIRWVTWGCTVGMIVWSMLNATPYVAAHVTKGWEATAFVLPVVVDAAFVGALYADEIASRNGITGGFWAVLLRLATGAASVFLNIGAAAQNGDWTGVGQHLIAPGILVLLAECGPVYRRRLVTRVREEERREDQRLERERIQEQQDQDRERKRLKDEEDHQREQQRQDEDRSRAQAREDADRLRAQRAEDERLRQEREDSREIRREENALKLKRLELDAARVAAEAGTARTAASAPVRMPVAPVAPVPHGGFPAPQPRTEAPSGRPVATRAGLAATAPHAPAGLPVTPQAPLQAR